MPRGLLQPTFECSHFYASPRIVVIARELAPFGPITGQHGASRLGDSVVASRAALFDAVVGLDHTFVFQFVERGVESAFLEIQYSLRAFLDLLSDTIAVAWLVRQGLQNQGGERPLKVHRIPRISMHRIRDCPGGCQ